LADVEKLSTLCRKTSERPFATHFRWSEMMFYIADQVFLGTERKLGPKVQKSIEYLLAVMASETSSITSSRPDVVRTAKAIAECSAITRDKACFTNLRELRHVLYRHTDIPVIAFGVLRWVEKTVSRSSFFEASHFHTTSAFFFNLFGTIAQTHPLLRQAVFDTLWQLLTAPFRGEGTKAESAMMMDMHTTIVTRHFVQLVHLGLYKEVFQRILAVQKTVIDRSLLRKFVLEIVETTSGPYPDAFLEAFCKLLQDERVRKAWESQLQSRQTIEEFLEKTGAGKLLKRH